MERERERGFQVEQKADPVNSNRELALPVLRFQPWEVIYRHKNIKYRCAEEREREREREMQCEYEEARKRVRFGWL